MSVLLETLMRLMVLPNRLLGTESINMDLTKVFVADCITTAVKAEVKTEVGKMIELDFETFEPREDSYYPKFC